MDAFKALAGQQGCSVDGTAASRNPLSQLIQQGQQSGAMGRGPAAVGRGPQSSLDAGMAAGMGLQQGVQGPRMMMRQAPSMVQEFQQMQAQGGPKGPIMAGPRGPAVGPAMQGGDQWVHQFERMNMGGPQYGPNPAMQNAFRESFGVNGPRPMGQRWAGQLAARPRGAGPMDKVWNQSAKAPVEAQKWADQMAAPKEAPNAEAWEKEVMKQKEEGLNDVDLAEAEAMRRATEDLVNVMASNPKFQRSSFFQEMSKVAAGESVITKNEIQENPNFKGQKKMDAAWDDAAQQVWNEVGKADGQAEMAKAFEDPQNAKAVFEKAYQDELAGKSVDFEQVFRDAFGDQANMFNNAWNEASLAPQQPLAKQPYEMQAENPHKNADNPFAMGMEFFRKGDLKQAILAFEAAIDKDPSHAEAWRMLGVSHQESDQDRQAIQCLEAAVEQDPYNLEALLGLGVSYVNELDQSRALKNLRAWVKNNPKFAGVQVEQDIYGDGNSDLMHDVMMLMTKVEEHAPNDPDVQEVLGVLYNVSRDYSRAVKAFRNALNHKPDDYSLWNKLGATLANSNRSDEALPIYTRALELKPRYARGWLNFGISHSNLGDYRKAIRAYLRALDLNPEATHIWNYLRICLTCIEGYTHLIPEVEARNLEAFRSAFDF